MSGKETTADNAGAFNRFDYSDSPGSPTTSGEAAGWSDSCTSSGNDLHAFGSPICEYSSDGVCSGGDGGCTSDGPQWSPLVRSPDTPEHDPGNLDADAAPRLKSANTAEGAGWVAGSKSKTPLPPSPGLTSSRNASLQHKPLDQVVGSLLPSRAEDSSDGVGDGDDGDCTSDGLQWSPLLGSSDAPQCDSSKPDSKGTLHHNAASTAEETGWGADSESRDEDEEDGDDFLEDFARELDGSSCDDGNEEEEGEMRVEAAVDTAGDLMVARAMQEEEWRRSPPPPRSEGRSSAGGSGAAPAEMVKSGVAKKKRRVPSPLPWPPWVLKEGEGLPLVELPDEILEKIAAFGQMPRCVSKRIQRVRVKIARERVVAALEASAKLPVDKAEDIEGAIFALVGCLVGKAYKAKARELAFNLRVGKNDPLRDAVISGALLSWVLVRMTSDELAPLSVRLERERIAQKRIREVTSSRESPNHTVTERFTCPECGHERTQYRTWRRKAVVDRIRVIIQCLQCRHSWEL